MRRAERSHRQEAGGAREQARDRVYRRRLDGFLEARGRKQPREPPREQGLAGAGGTDQEQVVATRGGDLQRPACHGLTLDVAEVRHVLALGAAATVGRGRRRLPHRRPPRERVDRFRESPDRDQRQPGHRGRLARVRSGQDQTRASVARSQRHRQHAMRCLDGSVEREFAHDERVLEAMGRHVTRRCEHADRDGQVEGGAPLPDIRGSEIYRDAVIGEGQPGVTDGAADAVATLPDRRVR